LVENLFGLFMFWPRNGPVYKEDALDQRTRAPETPVERLYRERGQRMWQAIFAFSGDPHLAEDVVAEAFAQALRRQSQIRDLEKWLWRTSYRIAAGELKLRRGMVVSSVVPDASYEMDEPAIELIAALARLSQRQRAAVILNDIIGYRAKEVATIIGSTPAAVRVHLMRGRRRLRSLLEEEFTDA
jgi:RNA polymerase sigma factor (sigma-70 family)